MKKPFHAIAGLLLGAGLSHAADYTAWTGSQNIVLNTSASGANVAGTVTKFPVLIRLTSNEAAIVAAAKPGGADIRFSKSDGTTPLPYEIDTWEPWGASIWVLVDSVKGDNSSQFIKMYWGNPAAVSESNPGAVFDTANGFVGVWNLGNAAGASPRPNSVNGAPTAQFRNAPITQQPVRGMIGMADSLTGQQGSDNDGDGNEDGKQVHLDMSGTTPYAGYANFTGGISYTVWVNPNGNYVNYERFLQMVDDTTNAAGGSSDTRVMFLRHTANNGSLAVRTAGLNTNNGNSVNFPQHGGVWKQVGFTKTPGNSGVVMYVDGQVFHTLAASAEIPNTPRPYAWIGRSFNPTDNYLNAKVDAPMLSKVTRSADWIKLGFENQKAANSLVNIGLGGNITNTPYGAWAHHRTITLNTTSSGAKVTANVYNFPLLVRLTAAEALTLSEAKAGGADIRFSKTDNSPPLPYHIESWDSTGAAIWVKMDTVKGNSNSQTIRMHWGNAAAADSSRPAVVFDTAHGHRAVFHMNQATGDVVDATANAVVGTNVGTTHTAWGLAGPARTFAGTNATNTSGTDGRQYINLNNPNALNFTGRISMSAWIRWTHLVGTENTTYYRTFINRDGTSPTAEVFLRIGHNAGNAEHAQYTSGKYTGSADIMAQSPQFASDYPDSAVWTHLAGVYDSAGPTTRLWRLYRNGVQIATSADADQAGVTGASTLWRLGRGPGTQDARWFVGDMDEVRIDNVTRDSNYIRLSYENQKPGNSLVDIGTYVGVPAAPTGVTAAQGATAGTITVSWTASTVTGGPAVTGYAVASVTGNLKCTAVAPATTCTITGVPAGTYAFTVVAKNSLGSSPASAASAPVVGLRPGAFTARTNGLNPYTYRIGASAASSTERLAMSIVDIHGKRVWSRSINPSRGEGLEVTWNGRNARGVRVPAGMYIVRVDIRAAGQTFRVDQKGVTLRP
jgi:hypothetical protein